MIILKYKEKYSSFQDDSELAQLLFNKLSIISLKKNSWKVLSKEEAQNVISALKLEIEKKIDNTGEINFAKTIDFGAEKINIDLRNHNHKKAFFLIKSYNLIFSFFTENDGELKLENIDDEHFMYKSPDVP